MTDDQPFKDESPDVLALIPVHAISYEGATPASTERLAASERAEAKERVIEECKRRILLERLYSKLRGK